MRFPNSLVVATLIVLCIVTPASAADKKMNEVFVDNFDGTNLQAHWEVINPDPEAFIVEEGSLLILSSGATDTLASGKAPNIFKHTGELPKGDWTLSGAIKINFQTEQEVGFIGVYTDNKNYLTVQPRAYHCGNWGDRLCLIIKAVKMANGKNTHFYKRLIWEKSFDKFVFDEAAATIPQPIQMRLIKTGRKYQAGVLWKTTDTKTKKTTERWIDLPKFTILRQKGRPVVGMYQAQKNKGETVANVDWIKLETPAK